MSDTFRTNTLTIMGAAGYAVFLIMALLKTMGQPVSWEVLSLVLFTSSALMGVDFGVDVFSIGIGRRPPQNDEDSSNDPPNPP